jgi:hypothetical protein
VNKEEKAQQLIIDNCSNMYIVNPKYDFRYKLVPELNEKSDTIIGYQLKYHANIAGFTYIFVAELDAELENVLSNNLYENQLYNSDIMPLSDFLKE